MRKVILLALLLTVAQSSELSFAQYNRAASYQPSWASKKTTTTTTSTSSSSATTTSSTDNQDNLLASAAEPTTTAIFPTSSGDSVYYSVWQPYWFQKLPNSTKYQDFKGNGDTYPGFYAKFLGVDVNYRAQVDNVTPEVSLYLPGKWDDRDTGTTRLGSLRVPANFIVADALPGSTPNNPTTIVNTATKSAVFLNAVARPLWGSPIWAYQGNGNHAGSGLSGGEVSADELKSGVIPHAIAINVWGKKYLSRYYGGFVAPATKADSYYNISYMADYYNGTNPNLRMGARLAIPKGVTAAKLKITTKEGLAMFNALRDYGAYVVDNSAWDCLYVHATPEAKPILSQRQSELKTMFAAMRITY